MTGLYFHALFQPCTLCAGLFAAYDATNRGERDMETGRSVKSVMNVRGEAVYAANETAHPAKLWPAAPAA